MTYEFFFSNKNKITQILIDSEGTAGVVYIDNFYFYKAASGVVTQSVQDFEGTPPAFTDFGNIAPVEVVPNPDMSGANTTSNTAKLVKSAGSEVWAGAFFDVSSPLDLINFSKMSIKTWSPKSGATVRLKLENSADNTQFFEVLSNEVTENSNVIVEGKSMVKAGMKVKAIK